MYTTRDTLIPFVLISLLLHFCFVFSWPRAQERERINGPIPVSLLPVPESKTPSAPAEKAEKPRTRTSRAPAQLAKRSTLPTEVRGKAPQVPSEGEKRREEVYEIKERPQEKTIVERPLPTLKELLPPIALSPSDGSPNSEGPIRLDTREPKYISYFDSIKRAIEIEWQYPEPALRQGLQGILILEFTVSGSGNLQRTRLMRSSGFPVLDEEAIRAVQAASPFHPIPPWIGKNRLDIIASFEYHDNRLKYGFVP